MLSKKELELEIANRGEVLKERISLVQKNEKRIIELEKRITKLEQLILKHDTIIGMHTEHFKEIADSLGTNLSITKEDNERFRRHVNNVDVHVSIQ